MDQLKKVVQVRKGLNQLIGEPAVGKTTLALLTAQQYEAPLILVSEHLGHLTSLAPVSRVVQVHSVVVAFELMYQMQEDRAADMIVLDDLASLVPSHPEGQQITKALGGVLAGKVWTVPILVINQERHPRPPGGSLFRSLLRQRIELVRIRPGMRDLVSELHVDGKRLEEVLIWPWSEELPVVRCLSGSERLKYGLSRR